MKIYLLMVLIGAIVGFSQLAVRRQSKAAAAIASDSVTARA